MARAWCAAGCSGVSELLLLLLLLLLCFLGFVVGLVSRFSSPAVLFDINTHQQEGGHHMQTQMLCTLAVVIFVCV